jgi:hypothetical protein
MNVIRLEGLGIPGRRSQIALLDAINLHKSIIEKKGYGRQEEIEKLEDYGLSFKI